MRQIGDIITAKLRSINMVAVGKVIYIHPEKRFYIVEFDTPTGATFRESFPCLDTEPAKSPYKITTIRKSS